MIRGSIKWALLGGLTATALSTGIFLNIPVSANLEDVTIKAQENDYSRSLYGVPTLEMNHYKLTGDKYLDYVLGSKFSVGRDNPSNLTGWYSLLLENPELLSKDSELKAKIQLALGSEKVDALALAVEELRLKEEAERKAAEEALKNAPVEEEEVEEVEGTEETKEPGESGNAVEEDDKKEDNKSTIVFKEGFKATDYLNEIEKEYKDFDKSVVALEKDFDEEQWEFIKVKSDEFSLKVSNSLVRDTKALADEVDGEFVKTLSELNAEYIKYVEAYEDKLIKKSADGTKEIKVKIDGFITSLKKALE